MVRFLPFFMVLLSLQVNASDLPTFKVTVELDRHSGEPPRFSRNLFGGHLEWVEGGNGLVNENGVWQSKMLNAVKDLDPTLVRFPGGTVASTYDWADGIGPRENRKDGLDFNGKPQPMLFGTDEFLELLDQVKADGMILVNLKQDPAHNADWLRYINENKGKYSSPDASLWEIGNESYYVEDPSFVSAKEYVDYFIGHYRALKEADPSVKVGAILSVNHVDTPWAAPVVPEYATWNRKVVEGLKQAGIVADFYGIHFYTPFDASPNEQTNRQAILASPAIFQANLASVMDILRKSEALAPMYVTEFGTVLLHGETTWKYNLEPSQGVYLGDLFLTFAQTGIQAAIYHTMLESYCFGAYGEDSGYLWALGLPVRPMPHYFRPAGQAIIALKPYRDLPMLKTTVKARNLRFSPIGIVEDRFKVPIANALGLLPENGSDEILLMAVNRSVKDTLTVTTNFSGKKLTPVKVEVIAGDKQRPEPTIDAVAGTVNLPPMSFAAITLALK